MFYCQPVFSRGMGLGNRLFVWARCRIFSEKHKIPMLSPSWRHIRTGPLRKGGVNLLTYHRQILLWDLFQERPEDIQGLKKIYLDITANKIPEPDTDQSLVSYEETNRDLIILFKGYADYFNPLVGYESFLKEELHTITKLKWLSLVKRYKSVPIALNVRRGKDFGAYRTPLSWFIETLKLVRELVGSPVHAFVVSDSTEQDLFELLRLENMTFIRPGCAISDLLILSEAKILVASGGSTFSAWASFLGQMPTVTHPQYSSNYLLERQKNYLGALDPSCPSKAFITQTQKILGGCEIS
jgi:hypothetical protein